MSKITGKQYAHDKFITPKVKAAKTNVTAKKKKRK